MKHIILFAFIIFIASSCSKNIGSFDVIKNNFNQEEIGDLEIIMDFFDNAVREAENCKEKDVKRCYLQYFQRIEKDIKETKYLNIKISNEKQKELFEKIDTATFKQIWDYGKNWKSGKYKQDVIQISRGGKYFKFIKEFGKENEKVRRYYTTFMNVGDISPTMAADIIKNYNDYDISDNRLKLLIAIHYLTLNDQRRAKRNFKYFPKNTTESDK